MHLLTYTKTSKMFVEVQKLTSIYINIHHMNPFYQLFFHLSLLLLLNLFPSNQKKKLKRNKLFFFPGSLIPSQHVLPYQSPLS